MSYMVLLYQPCSLSNLELQHNLQWDTHVSAVTLKASKTLGFLRRNFKAALQNIRELAYLSKMR